MLPLSTCKVLSQAASMELPMKMFQLASNPPLPPVTFRSPSRITIVLFKLEKFVPVPMK